MFRRIILGILVIAILFGVAATAGSWAYQAGLAQGLAQDGQPAVSVAPYYYGYGHGPGFFHPFGFFPFGCFGILFPVLGLFLLFGLVRRVLWHGPFGHHHGRWGGGPPPMFEEWHRRAHGETPPSADAAPKA